MDKIRVFPLVILRVLLAVVGAIVALFLNMLVVDPLIIPNPCDYHRPDVETNFVFDLFYEISSGSGYHPEPTQFNLLFTCLVGAVAGIWLSKKVEKTMRIRHFV